MLVQKLKSVAAEVAAAKAGATPVTAATTGQPTDPVSILLATLTGQSPQALGATNPMPQANPSGATLLSAWTKRLESVEADVNLLKAFAENKSIKFAGLGIRSEKLPPQYQWPTILVLVVYSKKIQL